MRLILILAFGFAWICRAEEPVIGRWEGSAQIPGAELKLIVDLAQNNGAWIGSIIIPRLDIKGAPLSDLTVTKSDASFVIKNGNAGAALEASFKGRFTTPDALIGDFVQGGNTAPFALKKMGPSQVEVPPQSTAVTKEIEGEWKGEYELFGYPRKVSLKLMNRTPKEATAEFVVVGKKTNNLPVDLVTQEGEVLTINSHETGITYEGHFKKEEINGVLVQGPLEIPLVLHRAK